MKDDNVFLLRELDKFTSITEALKNQKMEYQSKVLKCEIVEANYYISQQLDVPLATKLFCLSKLRIVEGKPRSIETTYIEYSLVKGLENKDYNDTSFYATMEETFGYRIIKSQEEILLVEGNEKECALLEMDQGDEVLLIKGTTFKDKGKPFEYFEIVCDPSFYRFRSVSNI